MIFGPNVVVVTEHALVNVSEQVRSALLSLSKRSPPTASLSVECILHDYCLHKEFQLSYTAHRHSLCPRSVSNNAVGQAVDRPTFTSVLFSAFCVGLWTGNL